MLTWISENLATIIVCAILLCAVAAVIAGMIRDRKKGRSSCGCGCANCPMKGGCHSQAAAGKER